VGAVALGFLFKSEAIDWHTALLIAGVAVTCVSFASFLINFRKEMAQEFAPMQPTFQPLSAGELAVAV
jgi:MFS transporter, NNP family, nitrate/nitrite transporter